MEGRPESRYKNRVFPDGRYFHRRLDCGLLLAVEVLPARKSVSLEMRFLSGMAAEPADRLGLAFLTEQTISKGTERRSGQGLSDAFDALGALHGSWVGRESIGFRCTCLPEYVDGVLDLFQEMLRTPTFPEESCRIAVELANQELTALEDDPGELARKYSARHAYGPLLGRHPYGERDTLARIGRNDIISYWQQNICAGRLLVAAAGPVDPPRLVERLEAAFAGFGMTGTPGWTSAEGAAEAESAFTPGRWHYEKELEQQQIVICWPGVPMTHADHPVERVLLSLLGEGMSSRLFTEVREKLGLVYWVGAWHEHPRRAGMIHLGASSTPGQCARTHATLLREVDRLADDLTAGELARAQTLLIARSDTHGDITRARTSELAADLFYYERPVSIEEKNAAVASVTIEDIRRYLHEHPRDGLCVVTLGPTALADSATDAASSQAEAVSAVGAGVPPPNAVAARPASETCA